jgi:hypothetical protein
MKKNYLRLLLFFQALINAPILPCFAESRTATTTVVVAPIDSELIKPIALGVNLSQVAKDNYSALAEMLNKLIANINAMISSDTTKSEAKALIEEIYTAVKESDYDMLAAVKFLSNMENLKKYPQIHAFLIDYISCTSLICYVQANDKKLDTASQFVSSPYYKTLNLSNNYMGTVVTNILKGDSEVTIEQLQEIFKRSTMFSKVSISPETQNAIFSHLGKVIEGMQALKNTQTQYFTDFIFSGPVTDSSIATFLSRYTNSMSYYFRLIMLELAMTIIQLVYDQAGQLNTLQD